MGHPSPQSSGNMMEEKMNVRDREGKECWEILPLRQDGAAGLVW